MNRVLVILGHGGAQEVFDFNMPLFKRLNLPTLVLSPLDDPLKTTEEQFSFGISAHSGEITYRRLNLFLEFLVESEADSFILLEYDSFFLTTIIPDIDGLCGIVFNNIDADFYSLQYALPPWILDKESLIKMVRASKQNPTCRERGFMDRYLAALADLSGVPIRDYSPLGFARNTMVENDKKILHRHIELGAFAFHGVKDKGMRDYIINVWNSYHADKIAVL